jgi:hypothetical protein
LGALRLEAVREATGATSHPRPGMLWYLSRIRFHKPFAVAMCSLVLAVVGIILLAIQVRQLRFEVNQTRSVAAEWEHRYEDERQSASLSDKKREEGEREVTAQLPRLKAERQNEKEQRAGVTAGSNRWLRPGINVPIVLLNSVSRDERGSGGSVNETMLPKSPTGVIILLALEGDLKYEDYRVEVSIDGNPPIWKDRGFKPNDYDSLSVGFNSTFFPPGHYLFTVDGVTKNGGLKRIGNYPLHVIRPQ